MGVGGGRGGGVGVGGGRGGGRGGGVIDCIDYVTGIGNLHMRSTGTPCYGYRPSNG